MLNLSWAGKCNSLGTNHSEPCKQKCAIMAISHICGQSLHWGCGCDHTITNFTWAQPAEQRLTWHKCPQLSSPLCRKYLLPGHPCFCRSSSITWDFAKLDSTNLLQSLTLQTFKSYYSSPFNGFISATAVFFCGTCFYSFSHRHVPV